MRVYFITTHNNTSKQQLQQLFSHRLIAKIESVVVVTGQTPIPLRGDCRGLQDWLLCCALLLLLLN